MPPWTADLRRGTGQELDAPPLLGVFPAHVTVSVARPQEPLLVCGHVRAQHTHRSKQTHRDTMLVECSHPSRAGSHRSAVEPRARRGSVLPAVCVHTLASRSGTRSALQSQPRAQPPRGPDLFLTLQLLPEQTFRRVVRAALTPSCENYTAHEGSPENSGGVLAMTTGRKCPAVLTNTSS